MCGIVGYVGKGEAQGFLLSGLKRLEYRGYDSAGIVTIADDGTATLIRAKGKISNLEEKMARLQGLPYGEKRFVVILFCKHELNEGFDVFNAKIIVGFSKYFWVIHEFERRNLPIYGLN